MTINYDAVAALLAGDEDRGTALKSFVDQEVQRAKAEAWDEGLREAHASGWLHDWALSDAIGRNPYREA